MEYALFHKEDYELSQEEAISLLDADEMLRYQASGRSFLIPRVILKQEIAKRLSIMPAQVRLVYNEQGKPYLAEHPQLHFNMSHTGNYIAIAFDKQPIGIDIEQMKPRNYARIAQRVMPEQNYRLFIERGACPEEFYMYWCACEALIKQAGSSIWQADQFPFCIEGGRIILPENSPVQVETFIAADGIIGAIAQQHRI